MRCPICGYNLKKGNLCPYCKITDTQIKGASNKKAKEALKNGEKDKVFLSSTMPSDINKTRLILITLLLGLFGGHSFYVGRKVRGLYFTITFCVFMILYGMYKLWFPGEIFYAVVRIFALIEGVMILMWMSDFLKACFGRMAVPVVLGERKKNDVSIYK